MKLELDFLINAIYLNIISKENRTIKQEDQMALTGTINQLYEDTQNLFIDNPITEKEIKSEI